MILRTQSLKPIEEWEEATDKDAVRKRQLKDELAEAQARIAELEAQLR